MNPPKAGKITSRLFSELLRECERRIDANPEMVKVGPHTWVKKAT